ncbi:MAG: ATP-dependent Clp protease ATP-binding subunit ClpX, partial [Aridibacter sp.]
FKLRVGDRGLMMILEEILLEPMYLLPSQNKVKELIITKDIVERKASPTPLEVINNMEEAA